MKILTVGAALVLALTACGRTDANVDKATPEQTAEAKAASNLDHARDAARVANLMAEQPAAADSLLTANGYTRYSFEKAMYEIAADSAMAAAYAAAKKP